MLEAAWPYFEAACMRDTRNAYGQARAVRLISADRPRGQRANAAFPRAVTRIRLHGRSGSAAKIGNACAQLGDQFAAIGKVRRFGVQDLHEPALFQRQQIGLGENPGPTESQTMSTSRSSACSRPNR